VKASFPDEQDKSPEDHDAHCRSCFVATSACVILSFPCFSLDFFAMPPSATRNAAEGDAGFTKMDAMVGYTLLEQKCPFPFDALRREVPLQHKMAQGLARGLSLDAGCAHAHMLALASSRLNAVKMNYSNILGVFPNTMFLVTGASGDGKSVGLWYDTQVMHAFRKKALFCSKLLALVLIALLRDIDLRASCHIMLGVLRCFFNLR
jgi:hypothetical protein